MCGGGLEYDWSLFYVASQSRWLTTSTPVFGQPRSPFQEGSVAKGHPTEKLERAQALGTKFIFIQKRLSSETFLSPWYLVLGLSTYTTSDKQENIE